MKTKYLLASSLMLLPVSTYAADMTYAISEESSLEESPSTFEDELMNWTPMSVEAFGYDIREVWRFPKEEVWSYSVAIDERLDLICDVRPREPVEPEVFTFGGLAFTR